MAKLDPFTAQIVDYVRGLPDEALLELVRAHLGSGGTMSFPGGGEETTTRRAAPAKRRANAAKATATPKTASKRKRRSVQRATSAERDKLITEVEKTVKASRGLSSSEVAKKVKAPQTRVASALRELKAQKRIHQGGERRFARYASDAKTAKQASERARKNASGPKRKS